jgi:hypothetical protein
MRNLQSLHNKTQEVASEGLPYNPNNKVLQENELRKLFDDHGLENISFHNINLY